MLSNQSIKKFFMTTIATEMQRWEAESCLESYFKASSQNDSIEFL